MNTLVAAAILIATSIGSGQQQRFVRDVARDIEKLKGAYPQLSQFSATNNTDVASLKMSYGFHTHQAPRTGGWTAGVPNPDEDGIWFYIDLHDPESTAEVHTQPVTAPLCYQRANVSFLILEGTKTKPAEAAIGKILMKRGVKPCRR